MLTATLIAAGRLDDRLLDRALGLLRELDPKAQFGGWIDEGDAVDLRVSAEPSAVRWALEALPQVDVVVQAEEPRFRKLLVADMDSTIIGQECIDELADFAGLKREVADITERAMQGKLDFKAALRERVALLSGLEEDAIARCTQLSGKVEDPIVDGQSKLEALIEAREEIGLAREDVVAIGDGANDRLMIEEAGLGVAWRAKPALAEVADARIDHHGLDALLWAQGIRKKEWVRS